MADIKFSELDVVGETQLEGAETVALVAMTDDGLKNVNVTLNSLRSFFAKVAIEPIGDPVEMAGSTDAVLKQLLSNLRTIGFIQPGEPFFSLVTVRDPLQGAVGNNIDQPLVILPHNTKRKLYARSTDPAIFTVTLDSDVINNYAVWSGEDGSSTPETAGSVMAQIVCVAAGKANLEISDKEDFSNVVMRKEVTVVAA